MPTAKSRRRIEIDAEVYDMLEREARWLHIPVTSLATLLIRESVGERFRGRSASAQATRSPAPGVDGRPLFDQYAASIAQADARLQREGEGEGNGS